MMLVSLKLRFDVVEVDVDIEPDVDVKPEVDVEPDVHVDVKPEVDVLCCDNPSREPCD